MNQQLKVLYNLNGGRGSSGVSDRCQPYCLIFKIKNGGSDEGRDRCEPRLEGILQFKNGGVGREM